MPPWVWLNTVACAGLGSGNIVPENRGRILNPALVQRNKIIPGVVEAGIEQANIESGDNRVENVEVSSPASIVKPHLGQSRKDSRPPRFQNQHVEGWVLGQSVRDDVSCRAAFKKPTNALDA